MAAREKKEGPRVGVRAEEVRREEATWEEEEEDAMGRFLGGACPLPWYLRVRERIPGRRRRPEGSSADALARSVRSGG